MYFGLAVTPETGDRTVTDFLFTMPRMLFGVSRILDLGGIFTQYNSSPTPEIADSRALRADWVAIGVGLETAINAWKAEDDRGTNVRPTLEPRAAQTAAG